MGKSKKTITPRVNFFDGQRIVEKDLDEEQIYNRATTSDIIKDFHGNGVIRDRLFASRILLNTLSPGKYSDKGNSSEDLIRNGRYDGAPIRLDLQPSDAIDGNRIELEIKDVDVQGRIFPRILIAGRTPNGVSKSGEIVFEIIEFKENGSQITDFYYTEIFGIILNNFSGGTGRTENDPYVESSSLAGSIGHLEIRESSPLSVFPQKTLSSQVESPNFGLSNFISSDPANLILNEIESLIGINNDSSSIYIELSSKEQLKLLPNGKPSTAYGQKFLSKSDNIQGLDLLLSVQKDLNAPDGDEFKFSGEIVVAIHELSTEVQCITDIIPENLIDFDPDGDPLVEISYDMLDLDDLGYILSDQPQIVNFNFSNTLVADKNIGNLIKPDKYYSIMISRRGDSSVGTIILEKGYDKTLRKIDNGQELNIVEKYSKQESRFVEYDPINKRYVDDRYSSLWYRVLSDIVEVTDGSAYSTDGFGMSLPKTMEFVGGTRIPRFERFISLGDITSGSENLIIIDRIDQFSEPGTHPRTGNFIFSRIGDAAEIKAVSSISDYEHTPIILANVEDKNVREAQKITGELSFPGLVNRDEVIILNPSKEMLEENLINRIFIPDLDCECNSKYRIISKKCEILNVGDFNDNGKYESSDILSLLKIVGNTINAKTTERSILSGDLNILDMLKADLNGDGTVDGKDIELLEDAVEGFVNFSVEKSFKVLRLKLENIHQKNDFPSIFIDTNNSGIATAEKNIISFTVDDPNKALSIRPGDAVFVPSDIADGGLYIIKSKSIDDGGTVVSLGVTDESGSEVKFLGSNNFNLEIASGTMANMLADNSRLSNVPFKPKRYSISHIGSQFETRFLEICDLRRYVETNFIEKNKATCICGDETCDGKKDCSPTYRNQKVLANDLFIPDGEIYSSPGVPYHGDYEFSNISMPLPPGSIQDCSIDLYENFIKGYNGTCYTKSGYPAMKYSDGTYVGCEDVGSNNDISKGRVKISKAIASLHVDAFIDGYIDGYADETLKSSATEIIHESFSDMSYKSFNSWDVNATAGQNLIITAEHGDNNPAIFDYTTINAEKRYGVISPLENSFDGDFIIDFRASRVIWESSKLLAGTIISCGSITINNEDGTYANVRLGWRQSSSNKPEIFFSGEIYNDDNDLMSDFDFGTALVEKNGHDNFVFFRFRRINEVVTGLYFDPNSSDLLSNPSEEMIKIGDNPVMHPGNGTASFEFGVHQENSPNQGVNFATKLHEVIFQTDLKTSNVSFNSLRIGRDENNNVDRLTVTFPLNITSRTKIIDSYMTIKLKSPASITKDFNVFSYKNMNADNLGRFFELVVHENDSFINHIPLGDYLAGDEIRIPITSAIMKWAIQSGHLPGYQKALMIEPGLNTEGLLEIEDLIEFEVNYEDVTSGVIFKVGVDLDSKTGIATLNTKNILYDALNEANRTVLNFGVHLKKSGFRNADLSVGILDLKKIGIGTCSDETLFEEDELCFFIAGSTSTGTYVDGPFPCNFHLG